MKKRKEREKGGKSLFISINDQVRACFVYQLDNIQASLVYTWYYSAPTYNIHTINPPFTVERIDLLLTHAKTVDHPSVDHYNKVPVSFLLCHP